WRQLLLRHKPPLERGAAILAILAPGALDHQRRPVPQPHREGGYRLGSTGYRRGDRADHVPVVSGAGRKRRGAWDCPTVFRLLFLRLPASSRGLKPRERRDYVAALGRGLAGRLAMVRNRERGHIVRPICPTCAERTPR